MKRTVISVVAAGSYVALCARAVYADEWNWTLGHPWLVLIGLHVLLGIVVGSWWGLPLPLVPFVLAIPASDWHCDDSWACIGEPLALYILVGSLFIGLPCVAAGLSIADRLSWHFDFGAKNARSS
jgi:hypothetical protein